MDEVRKAFLKEQIKSLTEGADDAELLELIYSLLMRATTG